MNRRGFLQTLLSTAAVAATPSLLAKAVEHAYLTGIVENQTFVLSAPMIILDVGVVIRNCRFTAAKGYDGVLLRIEAGSESVIGNCILDGENPVMLCNVSCLNLRTGSSMTISPPALVAPPVDSLRGA